MAVKGNYHKEIQKILEDCINILEEDGIKILIPLNGLVGPLGVTQLPLEDDGCLPNVIGHNTTTPPLARAQSQLNVFLFFF